jgi:hypothetical protein
MRVCWNKYIFIIIYYHMFCLIGCADGPGQCQDPTTSAAHSCPFDRREGV